MRTVYFEVVIARQIWVVCGRMTQILLEKKVGLQLFVIHFCLAGNTNINIHMNVFLTSGELSMY